MGCFPQPFLVRFGNASISLVEQLCLLNCYHAANLRCLGVNYGTRVYYYI